MFLMRNNIEYFIGVVEDRMDPLKQGRVRVRVFGDHPPMKAQGAVNGIPTSDLGWMSIVQSTNSAAMSGIGGAVTGMVEGTKVYGHWLDKYHTNGIIIGSIGSQHLSKPNNTLGFSDPTGQYPLYLGNDTNPLNEGGTVGDGYTTNIIQDSNLDTGINPDDTDLSDIPEDPDPDYTIEAMLRRDEGLRVKVYWDTEGYPTIGIGHLITSTQTRDMAAINAELSKQVGRTVTGNPGTISVEEASALFKKDVEKMLADIVRNATVGPVWAKMNGSRKLALENMCFQMGVGGVAKFQRMLAAMFIGDWKSAYKEARSSVWYSQTKGRASRVSNIILVGNLESYGIMAPARTAKSVGAAATAISNDNPEDPYTPTDSRILFKEPESSYKGEYPYVQTMHTEGGHVQEFDNTPGYERYRLYHPTGSYVEVAPDGRRTTKSVADDYFMVQGDGNKYIAGDSHTNVGGDEVYYNMGNLRRQTDGTENIFIRGDDTKTVEGDGTVIIKGNLKIIVQGDASIEVQGNADVDVKGNCDTTVEGDYSLKVGGNVTWTVGGTVSQNVTGAWTQTMQTMSSKASGNYAIDGSRVDIG
ncbi:baseplate hub subunit and tail lysozyme [Erwinia phage Cronus]|uniref:Baseplate central spike protein n=1 Tax=Erwinia phage Cronus TaxID=2163633 RepID=A0A2S1GLP3_9CAUD|nr:baseplate hub subunit and tail lysozyme [Erwinia phage Cronus]AWD90299.1 baseplate hub and tail lysozyme [Erwinia phage Cronus]